MTPLCGWPPLVFRRISERSIPWLSRKNYPRRNAATSSLFLCWSWACCRWAKTVFLIWFLRVLETYYAAQPLARVKIMFLEACFLHVLETAVQTTFLGNATSLVIRCLRFVCEWEWTHCRPMREFTAYGRTHTIEFSTPGCKERSAQLMRKRMKVKLWIDNYNIKVYIKLLLKRSAVCWSLILQPLYSFPNTCK